jgi:hypothetical protein
MSRRLVANHGVLGHGDNGIDAIAEVFCAICAQPVADDGVTFDVAGLQTVIIRDDGDYAGVRVRTTAIIAGARVPTQVDIGFGGAVTPNPIEIDYPTLLDNPASRLKAYPVETVVAEKFEALVTLGIANSRMKDFYDLWLIARAFEFRLAVLTQAVQRTFERRGTKLPVGTPVGLTNSRRHGLLSGAPSLAVTAWQRRHLHWRLRLAIYMAF